MEVSGVLSVASDSILQSYVLSIGLKRLFLRNSPRKPKKQHSPLDLCGSQSGVTQLSHNSHIQVILIGDYMFCDLVIMIVMRLSY